MIFGKKTIKTATILTLFLFICFSFQTDFMFAKKKEEDVLFKAKSLIEEGDFNKAIKELNNIIETLKTNVTKKNKLAEAYYLLAKVYYIGGMESDFENNIKMMFKTYPEYSLQETDLNLIEIVEKIKIGMGLEKKIDKPEEKSEKKVIGKPTTKKKKKFPFLLIIGSVVVVGLFLFFLLKKKNTEDNLSPEINVSTSSLNPYCDQGLNAQSQQYTISNSGIGTLNYSITDNVEWLNNNPTSGASIGEADMITVNYTSSELSNGTYYATITISDAEAVNSPQTISVTLTVADCSIPDIPSVITYPDEASPGENFEISWSSVSNVTSYELQRATNAGFSGATTVLEENSTSWIQPGLGMGEYYYRVRAKNNCGSSGWRNGDMIDID